MASPPTERWRFWLTVVLLALGLALLAATRNNEGEGRRFTSYDLNGQLRCWRVWWERSPLPPAPTDDNLYEFMPEVYRVLTPALCSIFPYLGDPLRVYHAVRLALLALALVLLVAIWRRHGFTAAGALVVMLLYAAALSGSWYRFRLRDVLHAVLLLVCMAGLLNRRWDWLMPAFLLAALNREDAVLVPLLAGLVYLLGDRDRWLLWAMVGTGGLALVVRGGLMAALPPRPYHAPLWQLDYNLEGLRLLVGSGNIFHPLASRLAVYVPLTLAGLLGWRRQPAVTRACLLVALAFALATLLVGRVQELEHEAYALLFLVPPAVAGLVPEVLEPGAGASPGTRSGTNLCL